ncbi:MAG: hypothetical protein JWR21_916 [Herminiimonas sp.]|nr:hypothetical protein [Herminiimonas sp.]
MENEFTHHPSHPKTELTYASAGPVSATASPDGATVAIDFVSASDPTKALRLAFASDQIENFVSALRHLQKAIQDPTSGVHFQKRH